MHIVWLNMRIGFVLVNLGRKGGAEKRFFNIMHKLRDLNRVFLSANSSVIKFGRDLGFDFNGISVHEIIKDKPALGETGPEEEKSLSILRNIIKTATSKKLRGFIREFWTVIKLNYLIYLWSRRNRLNVVHSVQASGIYTLGQNLTRAKSVYTYMDYEIKNGYPFRWIKNMGLRSVFKLVNEYDFLSSMIPRDIELKGLKLNKNKINIGPCSFIDFSRIFISEKKPGKIVFSARMETLKNPILALEAVNILKKRAVSFEFYLLGKGSLENQIKGYIDKNGLSNYVRFYFEPHVEKVLADSSIFLSLQEGNNYPSQALLEAMAAENAPICTDVGETRMLVDESVGFLVDFDANRIADIIQHLIDSKIEREMLGKKARQRVMETNNFERYEKYLINIYQK